MVERERSLVQRNDYVRPDYVSPAFGGDLIRERAEPSVEEATGSWSFEGDSLVLVQPRDQAVSAVVARVQDALPGAPEGAVREAVRQRLPVEPGPRWVGALAGERLELRDPEGRVLSFRKVEPTP